MANKKVCLHEGIPAGRIGGNCFGISCKLINFDETIEIPIFMDDEPKYPYVKHETHIHDILHVNSVNIIQNTTQTKPRGIRVIPPK